MSVSGPKKEVSVSTDKVDGGEATGSEGVVLEGGSSPVIYRKNREVSKKDMKAKEDLYADYNIAEPTYEDLPAFSGPYCDKRRPCGAGGGGVEGLHAGIGRDALLHEVYDRNLLCI